MSPVDRLRARYGIVGFAWWNFWIRIALFVCKCGFLPRILRNFLANSLGAVASLPKHFVL